MTVAISIEPILCDLAESTSSGSDTQVLDQSQHRRKISNPSPQNQSLKKNRPTL